MSPGTCTKQTNQYLHWFPLYLPHLILTCCNLGRKWVSPDQGIPHQKCGPDLRTLTKGTRGLPNGSYSLLRPSRHTFQYCTENKNADWQAKRAAAIETPECQLLAVPSCIPQYTTEEILSLTQGGTAWEGAWLTSGWLILPSKQKEQILK